MSEPPIENFVAIPGIDEAYNLPAVVRYALINSPEVSEFLLYQFFNFYRWHNMTTPVPDLTGWKRRFKRNLTSNETLNIPKATPELGVSEGEIVTIWYRASGAHRQVILGGNMALSADLTQIPPVIQGYGTLLSFMWSPGQDAWVCISYVSGV